MEDIDLLTDTHPLFFCVTRFEKFLKCLFTILCLLTFFWYPYFILYTILNMFHDTVKVESLLPLSLLLLLSYYILIILISPFYWHSKPQSIIYSFSVGMYKFIFYSFPLKFFKFFSILNRNLSLEFSFIVSTL